MHEKPFLPLTFKCESDSPISSITVYTLAGELCKCNLWPRHGLVRLIMHVHVHVYSQCTSQYTVVTVCISKRHSLKSLETLRLHEGTEKIFEKLFIRPGVLWRPLITPIFFYIIWPSLRVSKLGWFSLRVDPT